MRTGSLRGSSLARLVQAYHVSHAGPRSVGRSSRTGRKKLPPGKYHSAFPNCVTCWRIYSGEDGTALNICCTGLTGEESINSKLFATTTESAARPCQPSIYNCSNRRMCKTTHRPKSSLLCLLALVLSISARGQTEH